MKQDNMPDKDDSELMKAFKNERSLGFLTLCKDEVRFGDGYRLTASEVIDACREYCESIREWQRGERSSYAVVMDAMMYPTMSANYIIDFGGASYSPTEFNAVKREMDQAKWYCDAMRELEENHFDGMEFYFPQEKRREMFQAMLEKTELEFPPKFETVQSPAP